MKMLALLFAFFLAAAMPEPMHMPCAVHGLDAIETGKTSQNGYACEFSHEWRRRQHKFWVSCRDALKRNNRL
jgi:hypothetical protein